MNIDKIIREVKTWLEEDCGPGFGYRFNKCLDLTPDLETLRKRLEGAEDEEEIKTTGYAADVDGALVVECNCDYPNEWREEKFKKVEVTLKEKED